MSTATRLFWLRNRLQVMSPAEVLFRLWRTAQARLEQIGLLRATDLSAALLDRAAQVSGNPWTPVLPRDFDPLPYTRAADRVIEGRFDVFSLRGVSLGFPPDWQKDPKTGTRAPLLFGKTLDYRNDALVGDVKYLWEPNRHLELVTLAQAWHLSRDMRYAHAAQQYLNSWIDASPYPLGIHWSSSLEAGIRLVNWAFAWHLFGGTNNVLISGPAGALLRRRWLDSIGRHAHFVRHHLSRHSSANNHLLGELTGLFVAAVTWPGLPAMSAYAKYSARELEREVQLQNSSDGVNREQAFHYQRSVIDMMLVAQLFGAANQRSFSAAYRAMIERLLEFLAAVMDRAGGIPAVGDSDEGILVRLVPTDAGWNPNHSLLMTGAVLFNRPDLCGSNRVLDDKSRWLLGDSTTASSTTPAATRPAEPRRAFPSGGYWILGDGFDTPDEVKIVADAGPLGYLGIAAHGHADALSLTLSAGGRQILTDPGTYAYHVDARWRNHFRSTAAHNTVEIDGQNQSEIGGNFLWLRKANARCLNFSQDAAGQSWSAEHDGYQRLKDPVTHQRSVTYDRASRRFTVQDNILCIGEHQWALHWHCHPDCSVSSSSSGTVVIFHDPVRVVLRVTAGTAAMNLLMGDEQGPAGWHSERFDVRRPSPSLRWAGVTTGPVTLKSEFEVSFG